MEETYKGFTIKYQEENDLFAARVEDETLMAPTLKGLKKKIDERLEARAGFRHFETYSTDNRATLRKVRVTSIERKTYGYGSEPVTRARITFLEKGGDFSATRSDCDIERLLSTSTPKATIDKVRDLIAQRDTLDKEIKEAIEKLPRLKMEEIYPKGVPQEK